MQNEIIEAVRARLLNDQQLRSLVGDRVYGPRAPDFAPRPRVRVQVTDIQEARYLRRYELRVVVEVDNAPQGTDQAGAVATRAIEAISKRVRELLEGWVPPTSLYVYPRGFDFVSSTGVVPDPQQQDAFSTDIYSIVTSAE